MSKVRVQSFAVSIDGYSAGPNQDLQNPLGVRGLELMDWCFHTRVWRRMHGHDGGETGVDNEIAEQSFAGIGAYILGRNMFGPVRGPWPDNSSNQRSCLHRGRWPEWGYSSELQAGPGGSGTGGCLGSFQCRLDLHLFFRGEDGRI